MRLLLDTHAVLWAATAPAELALDARRVLEDSAHEARAARDEVFAAYGVPVIRA